MAVTHYPFTGTGSRRVFPIGVQILSEDYVRVDIDGTPILDTTAWDVINNSIVFQTAPTPSAVVIIWVADSFESIADLGTVTNVDLIGLHMDDIILCADNMDAIINAGNLPTMTFETGLPGTDVVYNSVTNTLTVPRGDKGETGDKGDTGATGQSIHHVSLTSGTSAPGTMDTYTVWGDLSETINLGTFNVYNGLDGIGVKPADVLTETEVAKVQQLGILSAKTNAIDFTVTDGFYLTATATLITVGIMALSKGQEGSFTVHSAENITGWGAEFRFAPDFSVITPTPPTAPTGTMEFWYKIIEVNGVDGGTSNIIHIAWAK